ncbi:MAG: hypothetical protein LBB76_12890 [Azoarcus sp.]|jgi:hypothetical protein|nr:hypothetical protein [Azoarcus sp.]
MRKTARIVFSILGSKWFYPMSFLIGVCLAFPIFEAVVAWRGEGKMPQRFYILAESPETNALTPIFLYEREKFLEQHPDARFLLSSLEGYIPPAKGNIPSVDGMEMWTYSVTVQGIQKQKVDLRYHSDDYNITSIYLVDGTSITPVYSTFTGPPTGLWCLLLGLFSVKCIAFISRRLQRDGTAGSHW